MSDLIKNKKVIVTGGAGFIGSHLVDRLLEDGNNVTIIDNLSTGSLRNLEHQKNNKKLTFIEADITDIDQIKNHFSEIDIVFHLAALAEIVPSINNPLKYFRANVLGTSNVVESSRLRKVEKLVYAASASCYGIPKTVPTSETAEIDPRYPYALTKYLGEQTVLHWGKVYKLPVVSLRLFNVYGPRSRTSGSYGSVFSTFMPQKLNNKPLTVIGDGNQSRDFVFVTDVAAAFIKAASSKIKDGVFNVGSGNTYTVNKLAKLIGGATTHIPKRPGEPDATLADISKIKTILQWEPSISFEEGVKKMLENINYWKDAPLWTEEKIKDATKDWFRYLS